VELISHLLGFLLPVAVLGPIGALGARRSRVAVAAAFGPALVCLLVAVLSFHTAWGGRTSTEDGDVSNSSSLLLSLALFLLLGAGGLAAGWGLQLASQRRQSAQD